MYLKSLVLILALSSITHAQNIPPYFIKLKQDRTLFAQNEPVWVTIRLGNQVEGGIKSKKWPNILESLMVSQGDQRLKLNPKYSVKQLYKKVGTLQYGAHKDFRLNLKKYFPEVRQGGIFKVAYEDPNYEITGKNISVLKIPMPDLNVHYVVKTSLGEFTMELDVDQAPHHVKNFALLTATQFYKDMVWHRVIKKMVIQAGDPLGSGAGGSNFPLELEKSPFMRHNKYAVGMARTEATDSATSQFYVCVEDVRELDNKYTVFGKVVSGFEVVDAIGKVPTSGPNGKPADRPIDDVYLHGIDTVPRS